MKRSRISRVFTDPWSVSAGVLAGLLVRWIGVQFIDIDLVRGNLWHKRALAEIILHALLSLFFGIFVAGTTYKFRAFHMVTAADTSTGWIGSFLWLIVSGCSSCSITIASYLGLASVLMYMPFKWLELKLVGVAILMRATRHTYANIDRCSRK